VCVDWRSMADSTTSTGYVHTLLFCCPDCDLPIAISRVSAEKNMEDIDGESLRIFCTSCYNSSHVIAATAKKHYVENWPIAKAATPTSR